MARKVVTLYVDDSSIKVLVAAGKRIKQWAISTLEPGLVKGAVVSKDQEVAEKIKQLLKDRKIRAKRVVVGISGLHSFTWSSTLPVLPKATLAEAVLREAKRLLPVPLEQLYISWRIVPSVERKIRVFAVGIPRVTVDALIKTLRLAGVTPYFMDIKPLSLARLVTAPTAVLVDVQPTEFDIVIMGDGIPQPVRTIPFPGKTLALQEKLSMVKDDLDRTIQFYNTNHPDKPLQPTTPLYVSGELADEPELCESLAQQLKCPVLPLSSSLKGPEELPNYYLANIGLASTAFSLGKPVYLAADLNALPSAYQPKSFSFTRVFALTSAIVILSLIVPQATLLQVNSANIDTMGSQLDNLNRMLDRRQAQNRDLKKEITALEKAVTEAEATRNKFITAIDTLNRERDEFNKSLLKITDSLPKGLMLTHISHSGQSLVITVKSFNEKDVLTYINGLESSRKFTSVAIGNVKKAENGEMTFILMVKTKEDVETVKADKKSTR